MRRGRLPPVSLMERTGPCGAPRESLHECHDCGQYQAIGVLRPGEVAACERCAAVLRRRRRNSLSSTFALALGGLLLLLVAATSPMLGVRIAGQDRLTTLADLPMAFENQDMPLLAIAVLSTTLLAPVLRLGLILGVLGGLRTSLPRGVLVMMARLQAILKPWSMIEVFMLGTFVAYTRLAVIAQVQVGVALYAMGGLMLLTAWADTWLDEQAMWDAIGRHGTPTPGPARRQGVLGCDACGLVSPGEPGAPCVRCETPLRHRRPQAIARSWALLIAAMVLYVPANIYPVLTVIRLGKGAPSTILGGVRELIEYRMWPLAALVFLASIVVPMFKLIGLSALLIMTQRRSAWRLQDRTRLYRLVDFIGRWSMIDVFMVAVLTSLVRMGVLASVTPGYGAVAFCSVVVLTMLAALSFDPRLMWDAAAAPAPIVDPPVSPAAALPATTPPGAMPA